MGSLEDYNILKVIGKGSYGEVHLILHKKEKKQYVIKKLALLKASKRERKAAELEAKLLSKLRHPNIVSYRDSFEGGDGFLYIVMGFAEGGDLYTKLREHRERKDYLSEVQVVRWFIQICMAIQYLHQRHILHRDLKTQNIFLTRTKMIKVGDLGIAKVLEGSTDMATTLIGTPYYMSPELFSNRPYNYKSDIWALGCCTFEIMTLRHAFNAKDMNSLVYKILQRKIPKLPDLYSNELCELIKGMLNQEADKRPSVNKILRNSFIKHHIQLFLDESSRSRRIPSSKPTSSNRNLKTSRPSKSTTENKQTTNQQPVFKSSSSEQVKKVDENIKIKKLPTHKRVKSDESTKISKLLNKEEADVTSRRKNHESMTSSEERKLPQTSNKPDVNLEASSDSLISVSSSASKLSSARERRRLRHRNNHKPPHSAPAANQWAGSEPKSINRNGSNNKPLSDHISTNSSTEEEMNKNSSEIKNSNGELKQFYTLLHTTLELAGKEQDSPPTTPEQLEEDEIKKEEKKLSPVQELSESSESQISQVSC